MNPKRLTYAIEFELPKHYTVWMIYIEVFLKKYRVILIILLITAMAAGIIGYQLKKANDHLEQDKQRLLQIATKLGYTHNNHLNFIRNRNVFYYDTLQLLFVTEVTREGFARKIKTLGLVGKSGFSDSRSFLHNEWDKLKQGLSLQSSDVPNEQNRSQQDTAQRQPNVTTWILFDEQNSQTITIKYAESEGEIWEYECRQFSGAIVQVHMNRL